MAIPIRKKETAPDTLLNEMQPGAAQNPPPRPTENKDHGMERGPTLGHQIRAHTNRPHKGDVGRPGTNEEVFQGSKERELK
jgi:hypothetical protein